MSLKDEGRRDWEEELRGSVVRHDDGDGDNDGADGPR